MIDYVLFSPLGMTDPTRGNFDGAFLHILRQYKPTKSYLYMTKEICAFDEKDDRYKKMTELMMKRLGFSSEIFKFKNPEIDNPQEFEIFYLPFEKIIKQIKNENPESQILVNLSSGTPQIKLACSFICATSGFSLIPVQVDSPDKQSNRAKAVELAYDIDDEWANLIDNDIELKPENRCREISIVNFKAMISREIILDHIKNYDYKAALSVCEGISYFVDPSILNLLKAGANRLDLNYKEAKAEAIKADYMISQPISGNLGIIVEYILYLYIKLQRKELGDFTRAISPIISDLFEIYLDKQCKIYISDFCIEKGWGKDKIKYITPSKMLNQPEILAKYKDSFPEFRETPLSASNMLPMIVLRGNDHKAKIIANDLRIFEEKIRNKAAHEIIEVSDEWLKREINMTSKEIYNKLKEFFKLASGSEIKPEVWDSYTKLNDEIERRLKK